jgi:hypothetical protein
MIEAHSHTNRELELMLAGRKPLAMFYAYTHELPNEELIPETAFALYVESGRFLRQDLELENVDTNGAVLTLRYVFYVLPSQEWRAQLMTVLKRAINQGCGWNEACERIEGTLLGYTDEENDAHCARVFKRANS